VVALSLHIVSRRNTHANLALTRRYFIPLVIFPTGDLAIVPIWARIGSLLFGYAVYFATRPRIFFGVLAGEVALISATLIVAQ